MPWQRAEEYASEGKMHSYEEGSEDDRIGAVHVVEIQAKLIEQLRSEIIGLTERLTFVLEPERPMAKDPGLDAAKERDYSPLVGAMKNNNTSIIVLQDMVTSLRRRVEL